MVVPSETLFRNGQLVRDEVLAFLGLGQTRRRNLLDTVVNRTSATWTDPVERHDQRTAIDGMVQANRTAGRRLLLGKKGGSDQQTCWHDCGKAKRAFEDDVSPQLEVRFCACMQLEERLYFYFMRH